jgi:hypothetical protein
MRKIIRRKMEEIDGTIYEIIQFEDTIEQGDEKITRQSVQVWKTPYRSQNIEVTDDTKSLINCIKNKGNINPL